MRKRNEVDPPSRQGETRLVYSTGGEAAAETVARRPADRKPAAPLRQPVRSATTEGGGKGIRVRLERRPGGRDITTVLGVPGKPDALAALARDLRAACGAGGTIRDGVIELQGDQCDKVRAVLSAKGMKSR